MSDEDAHESDALMVLARTAQTETEPSARLAALRAVERRARLLAEGERSKLEKPLPPVRRLLSFDIEGQEDSFDGGFSFYQKDDGSVRISYGAMTLCETKPMNGLARLGAQRLRRLVHEANQAGAFRDCLDRVACVGDTAAHYLAAVSPEEAARFKEDAKVCRDTLTASTLPEVA